MVKSYSTGLKQAPWPADIEMLPIEWSTELLRVVPAVVGGLSTDQLYAGEEAEELSWPDELSDEESNEEMEVLLAAEPLVVRRGWGESDLARDVMGAGVEAVDGGIEGGLEWDGV